MAALGVSPVVLSITDVLTGLQTGLLDIVAPGEETLRPGTYTAFAEYRADPSWKRVGLPMWSSEKSAVYSPRVSFVVTDEE